MARVNVARKCRLCLAWRKPVTMALTNRSAGSRWGAIGGGRHHSSAPIITRLLTALSQNGAAIPNPVIITPPSAGPSARLILIPTLLAETAAVKTCFGTSWGTTDCQAGAVRAAPAPSRNVNSSNVLGGTTLSQTDRKSVV